MSTEEQKPTPAVPEITEETTTSAAPVAPEEEAAAAKISLKTSDGETFELGDEIAMQFNTVKTFFQDDSTSREVAMPIPNVHSRELVKIIDYCTKTLPARTKLAVGEDKAAEAELERIKKEFLKDESTELVMEMILAADYLNVGHMLDGLNQCVAGRIQNKSVEYVRRLFGVVSDFTEEEERKIREEYAWAFEGVDPDD